MCNREIIILLIIIIKSNRSFELISGIITIESALAQRSPCWNLHLVRALYKTILESYAIKSSVDESKLIPSIDSWSDPRWTPHWHLSWCTIDTQSASHLTVAWKSTKFWLIQTSQSPMDRLWTYYWSSVNQELTEYWLRCQSNINWDDDWGYRSRVLINTSLWMPLGKTSQSSILEAYWRVVPSSC